MRIPRLFIDKPLSVGQQISLTEDLAHRLLHVLRVKEGYQIYLFNGKGDQFLTSVAKCSRREVALSPLGEAESLSAIESPLSIHLVQGISKTDRMDWAIQKAVELGVTEITPMVTEFTHLKRSETVYESKWQHYQKVIIHATEQSGRGVLPKLNPITEFPAFLASYDSTGLMTFLSPRGEILTQEMFKNMTSKHVTLLIGGEGGFSEQEELKMVSKSLQSIRLGPRILRTETAPVVILSLFQYLGGDFSL